MYSSKFIGLSGALPIEAWAWAVADSLDPARGADEQAGLKNITAASPSATAQSCKILEIDIGT
jgi:hypothetical protein